MWQVSMYYFDYFANRVESVARVVYNILKSIGGFFMIIKENLKHYRKKLGLTQEELSKLSGVSYSSITKFESGARTSATQSAIAALAIALKVQISDIYDERDYIYGDPFDFLDEEVTSHLGHLKANWKPLNVDDYSVAPRKLQAMLDILGVSAEGCEEGMIINTQVLEQHLAQRLDGRETIIEKPALRKALIKQPAMLDFYNAVLHYISFEYDKMVKTGEIITK